MKVTILLAILLSILKGTKQAGYEGEKKNLSLLWLNDELIRSNYESTNQQILFSPIFFTNISKFEATENGNNWSRFLTASSSRRF